MLELVHKIETLCTNGSYALPVIKQSVKALKRRHVWSNNMTIMSGLQVLHWPRRILTTESDTLSDPKFMA